MYSSRSEVLGIEIRVCVRAVKQYELLVSCAGQRGLLHPRVLPYTLSGSALASFLAPSSAVPPNSSGHASSSEPELSEKKPREMAMDSLEKMKAREVHGDLHDEAAYSFRVSIWMSTKQSD